MGPEGAPALAGLRERKKVETRRALRASALRLFKEQGFAATSVDEIAARANVSRSTFFRYFGSKEAVLFAQLDESGDLFVKLLEARPPNEGPIVAFERALVELTVRIEGDAQRSTSQALEEVLASDPMLGSRRFAAVDRWKRRVAETFAMRRMGSREPEFDDELAAAVCLATSEAIGRRWRAVTDLTAVEVIGDAFARVQKILG